MSKASTYIWTVAVIVIVVVGGILLSRDRANGPSTEGTANEEVAVEETGPILLGGLAPLTGDAAVYGIGDQQAKTLAIEEINAAGGINGRELQITWQDGKCDGAIATSGVQKLLSVDKVKVVLGGSCSGETLAALEITEEAGALLLSGLASSPDLTGKGKLFFRTYPSDAFSGSLLATHARDTLKLEKLAVISENTDFAQGLRNTFVSTFKEKNGTILYDETFNTGETDFRTQITKIKAMKPDVIYVSTQTVGPAELILKQLSEQGVDVVLYGSDPVLDRTAIEKNPTLFEGIYGSEVDVNTTNSKTAAFASAYKARWGTEPEFLGYFAAAYDSVYLLAEAMKVTNSTEPEKIAEYFRTQVKEWQGAVGTFNFDGTDGVLGFKVKRILGGVIGDATAPASTTQE